MLRLLLLPLFLFTLSMACMGQTFQYSRGWTNGKRAPLPTTLISNANSHYHHADDNLADLYEFQENERKLERCLVQLQRFVGNALHRSYAATLAYNGNKPDTSSNINAHSSANNNNNNNDNSLYGNHHQSSELYEELNAAAAAAAAAAAGGSSVEPNDYGKH